VVRDGCAIRGASRLVECGLSNIFRVGGSHDGIFPLQRMVRFVSSEISSKIRVNGINLPINQYEFLENDRFLEFIP
jgi:long-chain-fatty-acyl-CoA reductase